MNIFLSLNKVKTPPIKIIFNLILLVLIVVFGMWFAFSQISLVLDFSFLNNFSERITQGFIMTILLSIISLFLSLIIGIISALAQESNILLFKYFSKLYVGFIRGTPLIMQIYLFFYIVGTALGVENRFIAGVLILSIFEGAYISEIIRGSLLSIEKSQIEAAKAVGFTKNQTVVNVIIPQLVARTLPALTGQFASIIKDSSLLSMISVIELTQTMREISSLNFKLFESYLFLGILYLLLTIPISFISKFFERKFNYEN